MHDTLRAAVLGSVALPVATAGYVAVADYVFEGLLPPGHLAVLLVVLGALIGGAYATGNRVSAVAAVIALVGLGPLWFVPLEQLSTDPIADAATGPVLAVLVLALYLVGIEYGIRNREHVLDWLTRRTIGVGLAGGLVHAIVAFQTYAFIRQEPLSSLITPSQPAEVLVVLYIMTGLVLLGGVPTVLLYRLRLGTPGIALITLFSWVSYSSWQSYETARELGVDPGISPRADTTYVFLWMVPLIGVCVLGVLEFHLRSAVTEYTSRADRG
ncbi:hypothetical protein ACLI4Z_01220 [Natrialbaceae archaeon A-arb3/5]